MNSEKYYFWTTEREEPFVFPHTDNFEFAGIFLVVWDEIEQTFFKRGVMHRYYGPAAIYPNGIENWWVNGKLIDFELKEWLTETGISRDWRNWSDADKVLFRLRF